MPRPRKRVEVPFEIYLSDYDDRWHGYATVGKKPNGELDRRHRSAATRDEVEVKLRKLLDQVAAEDVPRPGRTPTVRQWFTTWLNEIAPYGEKPLGASTLASYWSLCNTWIFPHLGQVRLADLDTDPLDVMYAAMYRAGIARTSVLKCHAVLRRGLVVAEQRGKVRRNVARSIDNPGSTKPRRRQRPLTQEQAHKVIAALEHHPNGLRWRVGLAIGPRQGEALGLRWQYVDLKEGTVALDWQLQRRVFAHGCADPAACVVEHQLCKPRRPCRPRRTHGCAEEGACGRAAWRCPQAKNEARSCVEHRRWPCPSTHGPNCVAHAARCPKRVGGLVFDRAKTVDPSEPGEDDDEYDTPGEEATHLVALPKSLVKELRQLREQQRQVKERAGELWQEHDLVFCQANGRPIDPQVDYRELRKLLVGVGVRRFGTHGVRRVAATLMLELGEDIAVVQEVLGHTDVRTTRGYTQVSVGLTRRAARRMDRGLFGKRGKKRKGEPPVA